MMNDTFLELSEQRQRELRMEVERDTLARSASTGARTAASRHEVRLTLARYLHALAARLEAQPVMLEVLE
jgi:hypothetical protein